jgi:hypothetical protein
MKKEVQRQFKGQQENQAQLKRRQRFKDTGTVRLTFSVCETHIEGKD